MTHRPVAKGLAPALSLLALSSLSSLLSVIGGCSFVAGFNDRVDFDQCVYDDCDENGCGESRRMNGTLRGVILSPDSPDAVRIQHNFSKRRNFPDMYLCVAPGSCAPIGGPRAASPQNFSIPAEIGSELDLVATRGELVLSGDREGRSVCSYVRWGEEPAPRTFLDDEDRRMQIADEWEEAQIEVSVDLPPARAGQLVRAPSATGQLDFPSEWSYQPP